MSPTRDTFIAILLQTRLTVRRIYRKWRRDKTSPSAKPVFYDTASTNPDPADHSTSSKTRRYHPAALPIRPQDQSPLPTSFLLVLLFLLALLVRGYRLPFPSSVVFDEVHFLRFVKGYYYGNYFFDIHPPLGKLILLLVTRLFCGPPILDYKVNGEAFGTQIYTPLRWTSAIFGAALPPTTYLIARELGLSFPAAIFPAFALVFEHLSVVETRLILLDGQLMFFMALCLLCALRLWGARKGTRRRVVYLIATAVSGAAAISVKWTALATPALVAIVSLLGRPFPRQGRLRWREMGVAACIAVLFYGAMFALHFWLLPNSGQGDAFMKLDFQRTLFGGRYFKEGYRGPGFLKNFLYLNWEMYTANAHIKTRHHWESKYWQWMINQRGLLYYNEPDEEGTAMQRIYLIVNPVVTVVSLASLIAYLAITITIYFPRKSSKRLLATSSRVHAFAARGTFLFIAYVVNILPYVEVARCTFLYHYLPPLFYALLGTANLIDLIPRIAVQRVVSAIILVAMLVAFFIWSPWIYATPLEPEQHQWRRLYGKQWN